MLTAEIAAVQHAAKPCKRSGSSRGRDGKEYPTPTLGDVWESIADAVRDQGLVVGHTCDTRYHEIAGMVLKVSTSVAFVEGGEQLTFSCEVPVGGRGSILGMSAALTFGKRINLQNAFNVIPSDCNEENAQVDDEDAAEGAKGSTVELMVLAKERLHWSPSECRRRAGLPEAGALTGEQMKTLAEFIRKELPQ